MQTNEELPDDFVQEEAEYRLSQKPSPALNAYMQKYDKLNPKMLNTMGLGHIPKMIDDYRAGKIQADDPDFTDDTLIDAIEKSENISEREHASPLAKTLDLPFQATVGAARELAQSVIGLGNGLGEFVAGKVLKSQGMDQATIDSTTKRNKGVQLPKIAQPKSMGGDVVRSVGQFVMGFGATGAALKGVGAVGKATSTAGKVAETAATGVATDFIAFGEHEQRLSNLIESNPTLSNPVTRYLKADPEDGVAEGRFKNALEGLGLGVLTDSMFKAVKYIRNTNVVKNDIGTLKQERKVRNTTIKKGYEDILKGLQDIPQRNKVPVTLKEMEAGTGKINWTTEDLLSGKALADIEAKDIEPFGIKATMLQSEETSALRNSIPEYRVRLKAGDTEAIPELWGEITRLHQIDYVAKEINAKSAGGQGGANSMVYRRHNTDVNVANQMNELSTKVGNDVDRGKILEGYMRILETGGNADNYIKSLVLTPEEKIKHVLKSTGLAHMLSATTTQFKAVAGTVLNGMIIAPSERLLAAGIGSVRRTIGTRLEAAAGEKIANGFFSNLEDTVRYKESQILLFSKFSTLIDGFIYTGKAITGAAKTAIAEKSAGAAVARIKKISEDAADFRFDKGIVHEEMKGFGYNAELLGLEKEGVIGSAFYHAANLHGAFTKVPGSLLTTGDDAIKGMFYLAESNAQAYRVAANQGLTGEALKSSWDDIFVHANLKPNSDPAVLGRLNAKFLNPGEAKNGYDAAFSTDEVVRKIQEDSLKFSDEFSFTGDMGGMGTIAKKFRDFVDDKTPYVPAGTLIMPFIKTISNISKFLVIDRGPGSYFTDAYKADIAAGGARAEMARARLGSGTAMIGIGWFLTSHLGLITGEAPKDPGHRSLLEAAGWRPNSVRIGGEFHDISWLDPLSFPLLLGANVTQLMDYANDDIDEDTKDSLSGLIARSAVMTASRLLDKSYAAGFADLLSAVVDQDLEAFKRVQRNYVAVLAVPNIVSQVGQTVNPERQDAQTTWESIKAKIGIDVRPRRDIFGRVAMRDPKVNNYLYPISYSKYKEDQTVAEMIKAGAYIKPPTREVQNVRLTPDQYEKMMSYMEEMDVHGAIGEVVRDEMIVERKGVPVPYSSAPRTKNATDANGDDSYSRKRLVEITYKTYLDAAKERLISEDPDLQNKILAYKLNGFTKPAVATGDTRLLKNLGVKTLD